MRCLLALLVLIGWLTTEPGALAQDRGAEMVPVLPDDRNAQARPEFVKLYSHSFALVVGIDAYQDRAWPRLCNAVRDAKAVAETLERHGFTVALKTDLTSAELEAELRYFFIHVGAEKDARLLLWFAGHGHTINDEGYIVPADGPAPTAGPLFRAKALSLRRFGEYMREADARHVLAVFDSCFGGAVFETARALPTDAITRATTLRVRQIISAGEAEQKVSDNSTFRKLFVDALNGEEPLADANRDGFITGTELGLFLSDKITNLMQRRQTPRYGKLSALGYDRGDFVFRVGGPAKSAESAKPGTAVAPTGPVRLSEAAEAWDRTKDAVNITIFEMFIRRYGETYYGDLARHRMAELKEAADAAKNKAAEDERAKGKAEEQRLALLQKEESKKRLENPQIVQALPRLRGVFVGVNAYTSPGLRPLQFAAKDATDLATLFMSQKGKSYSAVETRVLPDAKRSDVLRGLQWLEEGSEEGDINLLFLAGYGVTSFDGHFYYLAADSDPNKARATAVSRDEILRTIRNRRGAMIVMLDACHSGDSVNAATATASRVDMNKLANDIGDRSLGVFFYASALGRQFSYESSAWQNGAFTKAIIEGLSGAADRDKLGYVETDELGVYVRRRVVALTNGLQEPARMRPDAAPEIRLVRLP